MVDIIFLTNIPYLITWKFCNGLFTIVQKKIWCAIMGTILKDEFWNQAAFRKNFTEEYAKNTAGSKIKTL
jgi:hypothetical protein